MKWHPKETAPTDGSVFLAYAKPFPWTSGKGEWPEEYHVIRYEDSGWLSVVDDFDVHFDFWTPITPPGEQDE